jgi:hypothetical protein
MTANNILVAAQLLRMHQSDETITVQAISKATGVHIVNARPFLRVWCAGGWLSVDRTKKSHVFTLSPAGVTGLKRLVDEYNAKPAPKQTPPLSQQIGKRRRRKP